MQYYMLYNLLILRFDICLDYLNEQWVISVILGALSFSYVDFGNLKGNGQVVFL